MRYTIILLVVLIISCGTINKGSNEFIVEYKGALKNIMHNGDISAKANLSDFEHTEHFYALGAMENLKGEIQIFNSEGFNTMVDDKSLTFDKSFSKKATLLVYTSVSEWQTLDIPDKIVTYEQLESYIGQKAKENNLKTVDNKIAGHVDGLTLGKGMILKLPDIR